MSPLVRILAAVLLLAAGTSAWWFLFGEPADDVVRSDDAAETTTWQSSQQCRPCHTDVWDEWHGSHHQISYLNPEVRILSDDFRQKECQSCHLAQPVAVTGFGDRALARQTRPNEGIGCITCHLGADGRILARHDRPDVGCRPVRNEGFLSVDMCASCHNQHGTSDQWRESRYAAEGEQCSDCHMPSVERVTDAGETFLGKQHVFAGAHDVTMLRRAGRFEVEVDGDELVLALTNVGAGHNFPTEERHRAVDMTYRFVAADGTAGEWQRAYRFRQPYRDEPGENTQLPAHARHAERIPIPDDAVAAHARLWYRLKPYIDDDDPGSTLLEEREVQIP